MLLKAVFGDLSRAYNFVQVHPICYVAKMLTIPASLAIRNIGTNVCTKTLSQISKGNLHASIKRNSLVFQNSLESNCLPTLHICPVFYYRSGRVSGQLMWQTSKQFHLQIHASSDEDYRSSRNIAVNLFRRYRNVINRGGSDNLKEFIDVGVNAYALGCTDESLRRELLDMKNSGIEVEGLQSYGGGTSVAYKIVSEEVQECILWLSIVFITIMCTPQPTIVRWSSTSPVSIEIMHQWKGFCALIANAYYKRGMAWLPVKTLQLEQMAVMGSSEEPSVVASRMRLVFTTLEVLHPRFSGDNLEKNKVLYARLEKIAVKHQCKPSQLALAWILHQGNDVVPIPGTTKIKHLDDNIDALLVKLTEEDMKDISSAVSVDEVAGDRLYGHLVPHSWKFANTPAKESNVST